MAPHLLHAALDGVLHLLVRHLDRGVPLRLLHEQLLVDHLTEHLPLDGLSARRIRRELQALRLLENEPLLEL